MARQFKVFAVSLLLACLFSFPVYADFTATDSVNLSTTASKVSGLYELLSTGVIGKAIISIESYTKTYLPYIDNRLATANSWLQSLNVYLPNMTNQLTTRLDTLISSIGSTDSVKDTVDSANNAADDVNSAVNDLNKQEDQVFTSLDTSIGDLDFSGSALGQVVSGFTFIRAVFSAIYSSSPYISVLINLSCMLGVLALFLRIQPRFSRWEREHRDRST